MTPPIEVPEGWTPRTCEFCHQVIAPRVAETQLSYERRRYCSREHAGLARRGKPRARRTRQPGDRIAPPRVDEAQPEPPSDLALGLERLFGDIAAVLGELRRARTLFPARFHSPHEGYAILKEEVDELWEAIKKNDADGTREEIIQVAAMALRFITDCY